MTTKPSAAQLMKRRERDIFKLRSSNYPFKETEEKSTYEVEFLGPKETPYQNGKWTILLYLPQQYPYKSPSVGFLNKIYHPNIDFESGSVCLDVINQTWTPMYELINIFEIFLPQLLTYPNPASPLNHEAANIFTQNSKKYTEKVKEYIRKYALVAKIEEEKIVVKEEEESEYSEVESELSEVSGLDKHEELNLY